MKKLIFAFLLITSSLMAEQKLVYFTARVVGINEMNENLEIKGMLNSGWVIKQISASGTGGSSTTQIVVLLERK